jgi:hippurate hydrolase
MVATQPAEELLTGARAMIADGLLERFPFDEIYGLHNLPGLAAGHVAVPASAALASADDVDVVLHASGAHGAMPQTGQDAVLAAAGFVTSVQQAATRIIDARDAGVLSFGRIACGGARNILPAELRLEGTMRASAGHVRDRLETLLRDAADATERVHGVKVSLAVERRTPAAVNDPEAVAAVLASARRVAGENSVVANARGLMASDDFAEFLARRPGAFFFIGQDGRPPHHPEYAFDPAMIPVGAGIFVDLAMTRTRASPNGTPVHKN